MATQSISTIPSVIFPNQNLPRAEIRAIQQMEEIRSELTKGACGFFDLDETAIKLPIHLGSKDFRSKIMQILRKSKESEEAVQRIHDKITYFVSKKVTYVPVEKSTPSLLQECKIPVFGLTARGKDHWYDMPASDGEKLTIEHLKQAGYALSTPENEVLSLDPSFAGGVFFCYPTESKGDFILELFKKHKLWFSKAVFVDDKRAHVDSVTQAFLQLGVSSVGFHYVPQNSESFDLMTANIQLEKLLNDGQVLSNEEAGALTSSPPYHGKDPIQFFLSLTQRFKD